MYTLENENISCPECNSDFTVTSRELKQTLVICGDCGSITPIGE